MILTSAFDIALAVAVWTIAARDALAAAIGFVAYGLLLALVWVQLAAVDVALTEVAIGGGATGMLLLVAAARLRPTQTEAIGSAPSPAIRAAVAVLCVLVTLGLAAIVLVPPDPVPTLAPQAVAPMAALGLGNPVTAVLLAYRAFDTLLEGVVLLLALIGVWSLAPDRFWGGAADMRHPALADGVLALLAKVLVPIGVVVAGYIFWVGATAPGGKFQAGTVLAAMWVLVMMAGLRDAPQVGGSRLRAALVVGPLVFLAVGALGLITQGVFLAYPPGLGKTLIILIEAAMMVSIAATLAMLVAGPPAHARQP
jgi:multisubunit Na+/H+ antiporter MnhB subunit